MASTTSRSLPLFLNRSSRRYGSVYLTSGRQLQLTSVSASTSMGSPIASVHAWTQHGLPPCHSNSIRTANGFQKSCISTTAPRSVFGWMKDKLTERAQNKKAAKLVDQINLMANSPTWTIKMFANEINETLSSWTTKMPGASRTTELQQAKETQIVVNAMMKHLGEKVTAGDIAKLDRKEKLKLAIACKKPMGDLNSVLDSFRHMQIVHRILRYRKANGLSLPTDEAGLKMAFRQDGMKVMTKEEKQEQRGLYRKYASAKM